MMKLALRLFTRALTVTCLVWLATAGTMWADPPPAEVRIAKPAPEFVLKDVKGKEVKLSDFAGKALIVLFWATWDKSSQKQLPDLIKIQRQYEKRGFSVIGISLDTQGADAVKAYVETNHVNFPVLMANADVVRGFGGLEAIPTMFVIEPHQNVISSHVGLTEKSVLESELKAIFTQDPVK